MRRGPGRGRGRAPEARRTRLRPPGSPPPRPITGAPRPLRQPEELLQPGCSQRTLGPGAGGLRGPGSPQLRLSPPYLREARPAAPRDGTVYGTGATTGAEFHRATWEAFQGCSGLSQPLSPGATWRCPVGWGAEGGGLAVAPAPASEPGNPHHSFTVSGAWQSPQPPKQQLGPQVGNRHRRGGRCCCGRQPHLEGGPHGGWGWEGRLGAPPLSSWRSCVSPAHQPPFRWATLSPAATRSQTLRQLWVLVPRTQV